MSKVFVQFELYVIPSSEPNIHVHPDYIFSGEFDNDDKVSFQKLCDLDFNVRRLADSFRSLDYQVTLLRKDTIHINF